jgi:hypothetical protein
MHFYIDKILFLQKTVLHTVYNLCCSGPRPWSYEAWRTTPVLMEGFMHNIAGVKVIVVLPRQAPLNPRVCLSVARQETSLMSYEVKLLPICKVLLLFICYIHTLIVCAHQMLDKMNETSLLIKECS